jgi:hypothetical protein
MRSFKVRQNKKKLTPEAEAAWRERMIKAINQAHGYSVTSLQAMDTTKLVALRNRIGSHVGPANTGKLPVNRHAAKLRG